MPFVWQLESSEYAMDRGADGDNRCPLACSIDASQDRRKAVNQRLCEGRKSECGRTARGAPAEGQGPAVHLAPAWASVPCLRVGLVKIDIATAV